MRRRRHVQLTGIPDGDWRITVFDQWNDMLVDGLSTPVADRAGWTTRSTCGEIRHAPVADEYLHHDVLRPERQRRVSDGGEPGLALVATNIRFRDGSYSNFNNTDLTGNAGFNEIFPLFNWYVVETDTTRYKNTGTHVVYDAGGPADGTLRHTPGGGGSDHRRSIWPTPSRPFRCRRDLRVPGACYCASADCPDAATPFAGGPVHRPRRSALGSDRGLAGLLGQNSSSSSARSPSCPARTAASTAR